jgi:Zn-dependent protease with chaperone function
MASQMNRLPSRKWSIAALGLAGVAMVVLSYLLVIALALGCLALPVFLLWYLPLGGPVNLVIYRLLLSAFGLVAGPTILWSLVPSDDQHEINGIRIDLVQEKRLAKEIEAIAGALRESMPSEVYLISDANAFVSERNATKGFGRRRILALGLPLLQMLTIEQFRAVLAHEFAHYYAGDTRLGPWVYEARGSLMRVYENLGKNSNVLRHIRRLGIVSVVYRLLMGGLRMYWRVFMRITQAISRRQESRSDELACYIAGSQPLIDGLEGIRRCNAGLSAFWSSYVMPVAMGGFQPDLANGFRQFMQVPQVVKATSEFLSHQASVAKPSPFDSHPPLSERIDRARHINVPAAHGSVLENAGLPVISLIESVGSLEASLLKKVVPSLAAADLKPLNWETAGTDIYIPAWRKRVANFLPFLSAKRMGDLPLLVLDPRLVTELLPNRSTGRLDQTQRFASAYDVLFCVLVLCLLENGWKLIAQPGYLTLENGASTVDPAKVIGAIRNGTLSVVAWRDFRAERGIGDWPLAASTASPSAS